MRRKCYAHIVCVFLPPSIFHADDEAQIKVFFLLVHWPKSNTKYRIDQLATLHEDAFFSLVRERN